MMLHIVQRFQTQQHFDAVPVTQENSQFRKGPKWSEHI